MNKKREKYIYIYRFKRDICLRKETEGKRSRNRICRRNRDSHLNIFRDTFRNIKHIYPGIYGGSKSFPVYSTRQQFSRFIRYTANLTLPLQPCHEQNAVMPQKYKPSIVKQHFDHSCTCARLIANLIETDFTPQDPQLL